MIQTENTAIVLRFANYRDNDRMVTLLSPSRGRIDAVIRNCRKPKSHNLNAGELFMLLLPTLSRLTFSEQEWKPLLTGFLLHYAACQGFRPRLNHCVHCGKEIGEEDCGFDIEGGVCCADCARRNPRSVRPVRAKELKWLRMAIQSGSASWVDGGGMEAPFEMMKEYVEGRLGRHIKGLDMLPKE